LRRDVFNHKKTQNQNEQENFHHQLPQEPIIEFQKLAADNADERRFEFIDLIRAHPRLSPAKNFRSTLPCVFRFTINAKFIYRL